MAFLAEYRASYFGLKRNLIVFTAIVANDLKSCRGALSNGGFLRAAFRAPLRRHHIALIKHLLVFFGKQEDVPALNTRDFYVWHISLS